MEVLAVLDKCLEEIDRLDEALLEADRQIRHMQTVSTDQVEKYRALEQEHRRTLWFSHGCPTSGLYGDDGEMQCAQGRWHPPLDFKRDSLEHLHQEITNAKLRRLTMVRGEKESTP